MSLKLFKYRTKMMDLITISDIALSPMNSNRMKCDDNCAVMTVVLANSYYNSRQKLCLKSAWLIIMKRGVGPR